MGSTYGCRKFVLVWVSPGVIWQFADIKLVLCRLWYILELQQGLHSMQTIHLYIMNNSHADWICHPFSHSNCSKHFDQNEEVRKSIYTFKTIMDIRDFCFDCSYLSFYYNIYQIFVSSFVMKKWKSEFLAKHLKSITLFLYFWPVSVSP